MKAVFEEMYSGSVRQTGLEKKALRQEAAEIQVANATMLRTTCEVAGGWSETSKEKTGLDQQLG